MQPLAPIPYYIVDLLDFTSKTTCVGLQLVNEASATQHTCNQICTLHSQSTTGLCVLPPPRLEQTNHTNLVSMKKWMYVLHPWQVYYKYCIPSTEEFSVFHCRPMFPRRRCWTHRRPRGEPWKQKRLASQLSVPMARKSRLTPSWIGGNDMRQSLLCRKLGQYTPLHLPAGILECAGLGLQPDRLSFDSQKNGKALNV